MDNQENASETEKKLTVRLPLDLWRQLKEIARTEKRSLNSQIVLALEQWLKNEKEI